MSSVALWEELIECLDPPFRDVTWVKVPSHVTVEANALANEY